MLDIFEAIVIAQSITILFKQIKTSAACSIQWVGWVTMDYEMFIVYAMRIESSIAHRTDYGCMYATTGWFWFINLVTTLISKKCVYGSERFVSDGTQTC